MYPRPTKTHSGHFFIPRQHPESIEITFRVFWVVTSFSSYKALLLKLQKFKIFIDFCLTLPGANANHLYGILIEVMAQQPDEISDLWIQMQEKQYKPSEKQVKIMTDILNRHKMEIPISVL